MEGLPEDLGTPVRFPRWVMAGCSGRLAQVGFDANPESLGRWLCKQLDEEDRQEEQSGSRPIPADNSKRL
jgi:hypothetical protein